MFVKDYVLFQGLRCVSIPDVCMQGIKCVGVDHFGAADDRTNSVRDFGNHEPLAACEIMQGQKGCPERERPHIRSCDCYGSTFLYVGREKSLLQTEVSPCATRSRL